jgi:hypothetical protein
LADDGDEHDEHDEQDEQEEPTWHSGTNGGG